MKTHGRKACKNFCRERPTSRDDGQDTVARTVRTTQENLESIVWILPGGKSSTCDWTTLLLFTTTNADPRFETFRGLA